MGFISQSFLFAQAALDLSGGSYVGWTKVNPVLTEEALRKNASEYSLSPQLHQQADALRKKITAKQILTTLQYWSPSAVKSFFGEIKIPSEDELQSLLSSDQELDIKWKAILIHTWSMELLFPERYEGIQIDLNESLMFARRDSFYQTLSHRPDRMRSFVDFASDYLFLICDQALAQSKEWIRNEPHKTEEAMITYRRDFEEWQDEYRWFQAWLKNDAGFSRPGSEADYENQLKSNINRIVFVAQLASRLKIQWSEADLNSIVEGFSGEAIDTLLPEEVQVLNFQSYPEALKDYQHSYRSNEIKEMFLDPTNNPLAGETNLFASGGLLGYWLLGKRFTRTWHPVERPFYSKAQWQSVLQPELPAGMSTERLSDLLSSSDEAAVGRELDQVSASASFRNNFNEARQDLARQDELRKRIAKRSETAAKEYESMIANAQGDNYKKWLESGRDCRVPLSEFGRGEPQSPTSKEAKAFAKSNFPSWFRLLLRKRLSQALQTLKYDFPDLNLAQKLYLGSVNASSQLLALTLLPPAFQGGRLLIFGPPELPPEDWTSSNFENPLWQKTVDSRRTEKEVREIAVSQLIEKLQLRLSALNEKREKEGLPALDLIVGPEALSLNEDVRVPGTDALLINGRVGTFYAAIVESNRDRRKTQRELLENAVILAFEMDYENKSAEEISEAGKVSWSLNEAVNLEKASIRDQDLVIQAFSQSKILPEEMRRVFSRSYLIFYKR